MFRLGSADEAQFAISWCPNEGRTRGLFERPACRRRGGAAQRLQVGGRDFAAQRVDRFEYEDNFTRMRECHFCVTVECLAHPLCGMLPYCQREIQRAMGLCEQCQSISSKVLVFGRNTAIHHNYETFKEAVFGSKCYLCSQVWDSMNAEQKAVARRPEFEGIDYEILLGKTKYFEDDRQKPVLAKIFIEHGEDLWDCEEYDTVGGTHMDSAGQFAILNPFGR